jgi:hypothetical protein
MRTLVTMALTVVALTISSAPARAQQQRAGGPGALGGGPYLLIVPNVQEELKLTPDQVRSLPQVLQQVVLKYRDQMMSLRELPQEERVKKQRELTREMNDSAKKALALNPEQSRRFDQIGLQQRSIEVFGDPEVQAKLMLNQDQFAKIGEINKEANERFKDIANSVGTDRVAAMKKIRQLQKDLMDKALDILTDEQKASWKEMSGEPFEVRFERPSGGN